MMLIYSPLTFMINLDAFALVWFVFYLQRNNIFLVRHVTNNHVAAQYFGT